jgi:hypothetical protein
MLERRLGQAALVLDARFEAINHAISGHLKWSDEIRPQTERMIAHQAALQEEKLESIAAKLDEKFASIGSKFDDRNVWLHEKFDGLNKQFQERDVRTDQATRAAKDALDAALKAASELVTQQNTANVAAAAKSETSFTKQIDQIATIISTLEKALDSRITELKERIDRGEGDSRNEVGGLDYSSGSVRDAATGSRSHSSAWRAARPSGVAARASSSARTPRSSPPR